MEVDLVVSILGSMFQTALKIALPILLSTLIIGVFISVIQVVTQIQEMTLTFVPKVIITVVMLGIAGAWMLNVLIEFSINLIASTKDF